MKRWLVGAISAVALLAVAQPAAAFLYVSGSNGRSGDLIAVWVKNGFELIVNLGAVEQVGLGTVTSFEVPAEFDGSLAGAKFTALAVPNSDAVFSGLGIDPPLIQYNLALTTLNDPMTITFNQVADAQSQLDSPVAGQTWFVLLGSIPAAGQTGVVSNTNTEALIETTLFASYTGRIGFTTDAIGGSVPTVSTAVTIAMGQPYSIPLYEVFQTVTPANGDFEFGTDVTQLGVLSGDDGSSGNAILSLATPEPGETALGVVALGALAWIRERRARS
ncbi:MAG: hypothetical protein NTZ61_03385 [Proteobacteria bacterium]|nr:hypothetical protein [Pseudomonadota bacterium]